MNEQLEILKYQAKCEAEEYCEHHNISKKNITETENGYMITIKFPW